LSGQKRRYIVKPSAPTGTHDPLLATGVAEKQTQVDRQAENATPPVPSTPAEQIAIETAPLPDTMPPEASAAEDDGFFGTGMEDDEALFGIDESTSAPEVRAVADPVAESDPDNAVAEPVKRRPAHPIREAFGVFLLAGLGGAAGFHGSLQFGFEPLKAVAVGLAVGLTLGWAWIRWAERKR
jgi:hypothetical protein